MPGVPRSLRRAILLLGLPLGLLGHALACGSSGSTSERPALGAHSSADDGGAPPGAPGGSDATAPAALEGGPEASAEPDTPAIEARVSGLLAQMTLDEKVGQMIMVDYGALASLDDITTYALGALLPSGDEAPADNTPQAWLDLTSSFRPKERATRLGIPLIVGIDAVHGDAKVAGATVFPHDIAPGLRA